MGSGSIERTAHRSLSSRVRRNRLKSQGRCTDCSALKPKGFKYTRCPKCNEANSKAGRICRQRRLDKGLCLDCGKPNLSYQQRCDECRKNRSLYRYSIKEERREKGLCLDCGKDNRQDNTLRCAKCLTTRKADRRRERDLIRDEVFNAYGGYVCNCCGETEPLFLEIDHVHNNGYEMRKVHGTGAHMYSWLKRNGYPDDFQILCSSCNKGKHRNGGTCPHKD